MNSWNIPVEPASSALRTLFQYWQEIVLTPTILKGQSRGPCRLSVVHWLYSRDHALWFTRMSWNESSYWSSRLQRKTQLFRFQLFLLLRACWPYNLSFAVLYNIWFTYQFLRMCIILITVEGNAVPTNPRSSNSNHRYIVNSHQGHNSVNHALGGIRYRWLAQGSQE